MPMWAASSATTRGPAVHARDPMTRSCTVALLLLALPGAASAQRGAPLLKTDIIELLSSPVIPHQEVADLVRRNCLAFRPTDRDWTDFRSLGATSDVVASINGCSSGRPAAAAAGPSAPTPAAPVVAVNALQVMLVQPPVQAAAGSHARIVVLASRAGLPQAGAPLVRPGSGAIQGRLGRGRVAATHDGGFAGFPGPV